MKYSYIMVKDPPPVILVLSSTMFDVTRDPDCYTKWHPIETVFCAYQTLWPFGYVCYYAKILYLQW